MTPLNDPTLTALMKLLASLSLSLALASTGGLPGAPATTSTPVPTQTQPSSTVVPSSTSATPAQTDENSVNWSGYVADQGTYTSVAGTWTVPSVASMSGLPGQGNGADATWVGIGGVHSRDLIQAGTEALPDNQGGIEYRAWYELLPGDSYPISLAIHAGDSVSVAITQSSPGTWLISFRDNTTNQTYSTSVQYNSSLSSAEWIEEMPVALGSPISLDDFGTVNFAQASTIKNGQIMTIQGAGAYPLNMQNASGKSVAVPSVLGSDGASFSVSRTDASASPLALTRGGFVRPVVSAAQASPATYTVSTAQPHVSISRFGRGGRQIVITFTSE